MPRRRVSNFDDIRELLADANPQALFADGFEDALIGMARRCGQPALAVYDYDKAIKILMERDEMEMDEAIEFLEFNTVGAWVGENTPIFLVRPTPED